MFVDPIGAQQYCYYQYYNYYIDCNYYDYYYQKTKNTGRYK